MLSDLLTKWGLTNIAGSITAILAVVIEILHYLGCNPGATDFSATCNLPTWVPVGWTPTAIFITGLVVVIAKFLRPGTALKSFFGGTAVIEPPSSPAAGVGTVSPAQVAAPK